MKLAALLAVAIAGCLGFVPSACAAPGSGRAIVVLSRPVHVEARLDQRDSGDGRYVFDLAIAHGAERCSLQTALMLPRRRASLADAAKRLRATIGWRAGYLFVRTSCGGGNAWKCESESVFGFHDGRLVGLGTLAAWSRSTGIGTSWRNGMFRDADTDLEINEVTSHAGAPWFEMRLRERDGRLVADLDSTWAANAREYAGRDSLAKATAKPPAPGETWEAAISPRLGNAAVAKYCRRTDALAAILAEARGLFPPELYASFEAELAKIEPGALPSASAPPVVRTRR